MGLLLPAAYHADLLYLYRSDAVILYLSLGQRSSWWAPILTGSFSAIWGLGFMSLMGYNFDPVMLVIPSF